MVLRIFNRILVPHNARLWRCNGPRGENEIQLSRLGGSGGDEADVKDVRLYCGCIYDINIACNIITCMIYGI